MYMHSNWCTSSRIADVANHTLYVPISKNLDTYLTIIMIATYVNVLYSLPYVIISMYMHMHAHVRMYIHIHMYMYGRIISNVIYF